MQKVKFSRECEHIFGVYIGGVGACEWSKYQKNLIFGGLIFIVLAPLNPLLTFEFGVDGLNWSPGVTLQVTFQQKFGCLFKILI